MRDVKGGIISILCFGIFVYVTATGLNSTYWTCVERDVQSGKCYAKVHSNTVEFKDRLYTLKGWPKEDAK